MADKSQELFNNILNHYQKTGKIGKTRPYNMAHARKIAFAITQKLLNKKLNTITLTSRQGAEPLTVSQSYCQLNLFTK